MLFLRGKKRPGVVEARQHMMGSDTVDTGVLVATAAEAQVAGAEGSDPSSEGRGVHVGSPGTKRQ